MRLIRLPVLILLAFASVLAPIPMARAEPQSFTDMVTFATSTGRLTFEAWGDSTVERSGGGHSVGFAKGFAGVAPCAGQFIPANTTAAFNDTAGLNEARRRNNASTKLGCVNDIGVDAVGYPVAFKQYGCQIPVPAASGYIGPQVGYLAGTTANGAVLIGGDITATSTAGFAASGRIRIDGEIVQYTSLVANVFTGCSRGNLGTTAATHSSGAVIGQCDNGAAISTMLSAAKHPIGSGAVLVQSVFYMTNIDLNAAQCAIASLQFDTTATPVNTDTTYTAKTTTTLNGGIADGVTTAAITVVSTTQFPTAGYIITEGTVQEIIAYTGKTATTFTGITRAQLGTAGNAHSNSTAVGHLQTLGDATYAIGSLHRIDRSYTGSDLTSTAQVTLDFGTSATNGRGPAGPAAIMYQGLFAANRPYGIIQSEGDSQGGKTLNALLKALRNYDVTNTTCEFDAGLVSRYKLFGADTTTGACATALGGNQIGGFCQVTCTGHNESTAAATAETALVDPTEPWTIARQTTINGGTAVTNASTTAITVVSTAGSPASGHILIGTERIGYTSITATTYAGTITRGIYGTVPAAHADTSVVYQGNLLMNPLGLATDLLFDYNLKRSKWIAAGGDAARFWYVWVRPIPLSATKTVIADDTAISGGTGLQQYAQKEYRFDRYASVIGAYLGPRPGFIVADLSLLYSGGDALAYDLGIAPGSPDASPAGDQVHNSNAAYIQAWHRYFAKYGYSPQRNPLRDRSPRRAKAGPGKRRRQLLARK